MKQKSKELNFKPAETAGERLLNVIDACEEAGIPIESAVNTFLALEFQKVWDKIEWLEEELDIANEKIKDLEDLPASEFPRGEL